MPKQSKARSSVRHAPLGQVIQEDEDRGKFSRRKTHVGGNEFSDDEEGGETCLDAKTSSRILKMSRDQQIEEEICARQQQRAQVNEDSDDDSNEEKEDLDIVGYDDNDMIVQNDAGYITVEGPGLMEEDEAAMAAICGKSGEHRKNLADLILEKIAEKEAQVNDAEAMEQEQRVVSEYDDLDLPPKVIEVSFLNKRPFQKGLLDA